VSDIEVRPVRGAAERRTFLTFPWKIYREDPLWVPPLLPEHRARIDPQRGTFFEHGEAEFFIAWRGGEPVGRICAGEDFAANERRGTKECLFGYFECLEEDRVAGALWELAIEWGRARGLNALFGPFNLDYEDSYGVLIEGRDRPPVLLCGHSPPYYQGMFERFGFEPARGDNLAFEIPTDVDNPEMQRLRRLADRLRERGSITVREADLESWEAEVDRVYLLINQALKHLPDHIGWEREALRDTMAPFRRIADPELILFAEVGGDPVGWFPGVPNLNEAFQHANGLRHPWDYLRLWWHMRKQPACLAIKSVLVLPEYWGRGVGVLLFDEMAKRVQGKGYEWADLSLTSEDNPFTPDLADRMGAKIYKRYRVYRLPF
jgi:GNAT superfamily N-acetyltransferase